MSYIGDRGDGVGKPLEKDTAESIDAHLANFYADYVGFYNLGNGQVLVTFRDHPQSMFEIDKVLKMQRSA